MKNTTLYKRLYDAGLIKFIKYGLVGVLGLVVDMGVFYLLNKKLGVNYVVANITSSSLAIIHNFILNSYFTFKITDNKLKRFATFYLIALIGMAVSSGLLVVFIDGLKLDTMVSKLITVFIVAIGQFIFNKKLTFRKNKK
jgi:putative flippase GtrA